MVRFTKDVIQKVLDANEGFRDRTYYKGNNSEEENFYSIEGGKMLRRSVGKTSWSDSRYDNTSVCDIEQTRRILKKNQNRLNLNTL